jgi:hypothetical protein
MLRRACVDRQRAIRKKPGKGRVVTATYPFCASGDCGQGTTIATEVGSEPRPPVRKRLAIRPPEEVVSVAEKIPEIFRRLSRRRLKRRDETMGDKACTKCGRGLRSHNTSGVCSDKKACEARASGGKAAGPAPAPVKKPRARRSTGDRDLAELELQELLELRRAIDLELRGRKEKAAAELEELTTALGTAA